MLKSLSILFSFYSLSAYSQTMMDWDCLSQSPDYEVNALIQFNNKLVATGNFSTAGTQVTNGIAEWNGFTWNALGSGLRGANNPFGYETIVYNNELYVVGNFDSAGAAKAKNIAKWNGTSWTGLATNGNGIIYSVAIFNNELYVGGTFTNIDGVSASHIAKWNGSNWQSLGSGITGNNVNKLYVYQNELYASGAIDYAGGIKCNGIARWNGSTWDSLSGSSNTVRVALIEWQGKLLVGSELFINYTVTPGPQPQMRIKQWDGSSWSYFSEQSTVESRDFYIFNNELYFVGGSNNIAAQYSNVMKWNPASSLWEMVGSGINNYTPAICEFNSGLYCGGAFNTTQGGKCNYISKLIDVTGLKEGVLNESDVNLFPNPTSFNLELKFAATPEVTNSRLEIKNSIGQVVKEIRNVGQILKDKTLQIDVSDLPVGFYILSIQGKNIQSVVKFVKE